MVRPPHLRRNDKAKNLCSTLQISSYRHKLLFFNCTMATTRFPHFPEPPFPRLSSTSLTPGLFSCDGRAPPLLLSQHQILMDEYVQIRTTLDADRLNSPVAQADL